MRTGGLGLLLLVLVGFNWAQASSSKNKQYECGKPVRTARIVGGEKTKANQHPWLVSLIVTMNGLPRICGGTIIAKTWILTAAHCFNEIEEHTKVQAFVNIHYLDTMNPRGTEVTIKRFLQHEKYNITNARNDIALIELDNPLNYSKKVQPMCLPIPDNYANSQAFAIGWGDLYEGGPSSTIPMQITLQITTHRFCKEHTPDRIYPGMMCAFDPSMEKDVCVGDSGGPLFLECDGSVIQVGIMSWGYECASENPHIYTNISKYTKWISNITQIASGCFKKCTRKSRRRSTLFQIRKN